MVTWALLPETRLEASLVHDVPVYAVPYVGGFPVPNLIEYEMLDVVRPEEAAATAVLVVAQGSEVSPRLIESC